MRQPVIGFTILLSVVASAFHLLLVLVLLVLAGRFPRLSQSAESQPGDVGNSVEEHGYSSEPSRRHGLLLRRRPDDCSGRGLFRCNGQRTPVHPPKLPRSVHSGAAAHVARHRPVVAGSITCNARTETQQAIRQSGHRGRGGRSMADRSGDPDDGRLASAVAGYVGRSGALPLRATLPEWKAPELRAFRLPL